MWLQVLFFLFVNNCLKVTTRLGHLQECARREARPSELKLNPGAGEEDAAFVPTRRGREQGHLQLLHGDSLASPPPPTPKLSLKCDTSAIHSFLTDSGTPAHLSSKVLLSSPKHLSLPSTLPQHTWDPSRSYCETTRALVISCLHGGTHTQCIQSALQGD